MSDQFEQLLRDTLNHRAAQYDSGAGPRLRAIDYRPRRRRPALLPALGAVGLSGATAAAVALVTLGSGAAPAFAGWTPTPTRPAPGQTAVALRQCGSGTPVITDTRGPFTAAVYAVRNGAGLCVADRSAFFQSTSSSMGEGRAGPGQIQVFTALDSARRGLTILYGRVGSGVTAVRIERSNGVPVTSTVSGSWYLAWWPGSSHATKAQITTATGTQTVPLPAMATQSATSCGGPPGTACASGGGSPTAIGGPVRRHPHRNAPRSSSSFSSSAPWHLKTGDYVTHRSASGARFVVPGALAKQPAGIFDVGLPRTANMPLGPGPSGAGPWGTQPIATGVVPRSAHVELLATGAPGLRFTVGWEDTCRGRRTLAYGGQGRLSLRSPAVILVRFPGPASARRCYLSAGAWASAKTSLRLRIIYH